MLWARIKRENTGSIIMYKLPYKMEFIDIEAWMVVNMPGWIVKECYMVNPEKVDI